MNTENAGYIIHMIMSFISYIIYVLRDVRGDAGTLAVELRRDRGLYHTIIYNTIRRFISIHYTNCTILSYVILFNPLLLCCTIADYCYNSCLDVGPAHAADISVGRADVVGEVPPQGRPRLPTLAHPLHASGEGEGKGDPPCCDLHVVLHCVCANASERGRGHADQVVEPQLLAAVSRSQALSLRLALPLARRKAFAGRTGRRRSFAGSCTGSLCLRLCLGLAFGLHLLHVELGLVDDGALMIYGFRPKKSYVPNIITYLILLIPMLNLFILVL